MVHVVMGKMKNVWVQNGPLFHFALVYGPQKCVAGKCINGQISTNLKKVADGRERERTDMSFFNVCHTKALRAINLFDISASYP